MKLTEMIRGYASANHAIPAIPATPPRQEGAKIARIAQIAVATTQDKYHGYTLEELKQEAGTDADLMEDEASRDAFAFALKESRQIDSGIRPDSYTGVAFCKGCGAVYVPQFLDGQNLDDCRWCARREARRSRPKPYPVMGPVEYTGWQPFNEHARPPEWQGIDERMVKP